MILDLVPSSDPILKEELKPFNFINPPIDPVELSNNMAETMIANKGLGLAANQVGLPYRMFVITGQPILAIFNPKIVHYSDEQVILPEGCLSFKNMFVKIRRPALIRVRYSQPNGEVVTHTFEGLTARIFQHELDHLNGIAHHRRATSFHMGQALRKKKTLDRREKNSA